MDEEVAEVVRTDIVVLVVPPYVAASNFQELVDEVKGRPERFPGNKNELAYTLAIYEMLIPNPRRKNGHRNFCQFY
jgi:hypothetical protein